MPARTRASRALAFEVDSSGNLAIGETIDIITTTTCENDRENFLGGSHISFGTSFSLHTLPRFSPSVQASNESYGQQGAAGLRRSEIRRGPGAVFDGGPSSRSVEMVRCAGDCDSAVVLIFVRAGSKAET